MTQLWFDYTPKNNLLAFSDKGPWDKAPNFHPVKFGFRPNEDAEDDETPSFYVKGTLLDSGKPIQFKGTVEQDESGEFTLRFETMSRQFGNKLIELKMEVCSLEGSRWLEVSINNKKVKLTGESENMKLLSEGVARFPDCLMTGWWESFIQMN
jgi:hypothetical protein